MPLTSAPTPGLCDYNTTSGAPGSQRSHEWRTLIYHCPQLRHTVHREQAQFPLLEHLAELAPLSRLLLPSFCISGPIHVDLNDDNTGDFGLFKILSDANAACGHSSRKSDRVDGVSPSDEHKPGRKRQSDDQPRLARLIAHEAHYSSEEDESSVDDVN